MIDIWDTKWKNDQEDYDKDKTDLDNFSLFYNVKRNRYRMSISEDRRWESCDKSLNLQIDYNSKHLKNLNLSVFLL